MQILGPAAVLSKADLLAKYKSDLEKIIQEVNQDVDPERVWQLRKAQKADLYMRALQYLVPQFSDLTTASYSSIGSPITGAAGATRTPRERSTTFRTSTGVTRESSSLSWVSALQM